MPRKPRAKRPPSRPQLASEAARGDADFDPHLIAGGGSFSAVAIVFGTNRETIVEGRRSVAEVLMAARCSEWWGMPASRVVIEILACGSGEAWRLKSDGCWEPVEDHGRRAA